MLFVFIILMGEMILLNREFIFSISNDIRWRADELLFILVYLSMLIDAFVHRDKGRNAYIAIYLISSLSLLFVISVVSISVSNSSSVDFTNNFYRAVYSAMIMGVILYVVENVGSRNDCDHHVSRNTLVFIPLVLLLSISIFSEAHHALIITIIIIIITINHNY